MKLHQYARTKRKGIPIRRNERLEMWKSHLAPNALISSLINATPVTQVHYIISDEHKSYKLPSNS